VGRWWKGGRAYSYSYWKVVKDNENFEMRVRDKRMSELVNSIKSLRNFAHVFKKRASDESRQGIISSLIGGFVFA
jgi:hypothetical protein